jgi:hypothetical protein
MRLKDVLIYFVMILTTISIVSSNWVMYDYTASDGPAGIGFPFAFRIGGGGLCVDMITHKSGLCGFNLDYHLLIIDITVWIVISFALSFSIIRIRGKPQKKKL